MVAKDKQQAFEEILAYINKQKGAYSNWYCGIASDWEDRLFSEHSVPRNGPWWIARQCYNHIDARAVETALHEYGCDGGPGGGDKSTIWVYAYLKRVGTEP